jgi:hypothetical protein
MVPHRPQFRLHPYQVHRLAPARPGHRPPRRARRSSGTHDRDIRADGTRPPAHPVPGTRAPRTRCANGSTSGIRPQAIYSRIRPVRRMPVSRQTGTVVRLKLTPCGKDFLS